MQDIISLQDLLDFINRFSTEPNLSWTIPHLYEKDIEFEMQWLFDKTTSFNWYFKKKQEDTWNVCPSAELLQYLIDEKADLGRFEIELLKVICVQAICCHFYIEKANELIGKERVDGAIRLMNQVLDQQKEVPETPRLRLINRKKKTDE